MSENIEDLKNLLSEKAGPYGKIAVKEKMDSLGITNEPSTTELEVLIEESVIASIADEAKHEEIIDELKEDLL